MHGNQKTIRVLEGAASSWDKVATRLYFEGNMISQIGTKSQNDQLRACQNVFMQWLDGKEGLRTPRTWSTVIEALKEAGLGQLANDLKTTLGGNSILIIIIMILLLSPLIPYSCKYIYSRESSSLARPSSKDVSVTTEHRHEFNRL